MEFHDILHGKIQFADEDELTKLLFDLIKSPEINRLRNMRQMNFDVPLIQELGRSRRLPHSVGVANLAYRLSKQDLLSTKDSKILLAAAIMHDAAIPPYGHLVESEFKYDASFHSKKTGPNPEHNIVYFNHEKSVEDLIKGSRDNDIDKYTAIIPRKTPQVLDILRKHHVDVDDVISLICPPGGAKTPISADIDLDNIDNVHRMAAMLGWENARENFKKLVSSIHLNELAEMSFSNNAIPLVKQWLDFRERIYTMIIAHPECVPYNALQADLVREAVRSKIITPKDWWLSEPVFEERLRASDATRALADQLISGCDYTLVDYIWIKNFKTNKKWHNAEIVRNLTDNLVTHEDFGYFVWNEKGLISREINLLGREGVREILGFNSTSCMIAYVKKTPGTPKWTNERKQKWRRSTLELFIEMFETSRFNVDFPEDYTGTFLARKNNEFDFN